MFSNLLLATDSYKHSHFLQAPPNTSKCYHYLEARSSKNFPEVTFFGLQYLLEQLAGTVVLTHDIDEAEQICALHGIPFNKTGWDLLKSRHGGSLPLIESMGTLKTVREDATSDLLRTVFKNGEIIVTDTFATIRKRAEL